MPCRYRGGGGVVSQDALQVVSQYALHGGVGVSRTTPGGSPGPHLGEGGCVS